MSSLPKRIELFANVAIIIVAILLGIVLAQRYLLPTHPSSADVESTPIQPGTMLAIPGVDWHKSNRTLVMVLSTNCHFCSESAPFYQRLAQERAKHKDVSLIAVMPQSLDAAQKYLSDHGITVDEIRQAPPGAAHAKGTPTLIMVDQTGSVVASWIGKLPSVKELEVLNRFLAPDSSD